MDRRRAEAAGGALASSLYREFQPGRSGGVFVFVEDAAEAVAAMDVQPGESARVGDRFGQGFQRPAFAIP